MKKALSVVMLAILTMGVFGGCGKVETPAAGDSEVNEETPVEEEPEVDEPEVEEKPVKEVPEKELTEEKKENNGLEEHEERWLGIHLENQPQPTEEEKAVLEAELKEEVMANMDKVEKLIKEWLDIVTIPDAEYDINDKIRDLAEKEILVSWRIHGDFGEASYYINELYGTITKYTIDRIEYSEEETDYYIYFYGENNYWLRRNLVPFYLDLTVEHEKDGIKSTDTLNWLVYGPFRDGEFRGLVIEYNEE